MKSLKENILSNTNFGKKGFNRKLAEKLSKKIDNSKNSVSKEVYDCFGHKLEENDIIITINCYNSDIGVISNLQVPDDKDCILVYLPIRDIEIRVFHFNVIKLDDPEKLLKL